MKDYIWIEEKVNEQRRRRGDMTKQGNKMQEKSEEERGDESKFNCFSLHIVV